MINLTSGGICFRPSGVLRICQRSCNKQHCFLLAGLILGSGPCQLFWRLCCCSLRALLQDSGFFLSSSSLKQMLVLDVPAGRGKRASESQCGQGSCRLQLCSLDRWFTRSLAMMWCSISHPMRCCTRRFRAEQSRWGEEEGAGSLPLSSIISNQQSWSRRGMGEGRKDWMNTRRSLQLHPLTWAAIVLWLNDTCVILPLSVFAFYPRLFLCFLCGREKQRDNSSQRGLSGLVMV